MYHSPLIVGSKVQFTENRANPTVGVSGDLSEHVSPPYSKNFDKINESKVELIYTVTDSKNDINHYGSYDQTQELARFQSLGFVLTLLFISIYLYYFSEKMLEQHFDNEITQNTFYIFFYFISFIFIPGWIVIVFLSKGIPTTFMAEEIFHYPNQFIFGIVLSNFLLLGIGIFKFILITSMSNSNKNETIFRVRRFSIVAIFFSFLNVVANILTVW